MNHGFKGRKSAAGVTATVMWRRVAIQAFKSESANALLQLVHAWIQCKGDIPHAA